MKFIFVLLASVLLLTACSSSKKILVKDTLQGSWSFVGSTEHNTANTPFPDLPELTFETATGKVSGSTGCNKIMGSYSVSGTGFSFGPLGSTKRMCPNMDLENFMTRFLNNVGSYKLDLGRLYLYSKDDKTKFVVFGRPKPKK